MDDQTEVPERYQVLYSQDGEEKLSDPGTLDEARKDAEEMAGKDGISVVAVLTEAAARDRFADPAPPLTMETVFQANPSRDEELADSLLPEEPTKEQLDAWEGELKSTGALVQAEAGQVRNRHEALRYAIRLITAPHSPFRTERASADEVVAYARSFARFLNNG